jgi:hypothetical protein
LNPDQELSSGRDALKEAYEVSIRLYEFHARWRWGTFAGFLTVEAALALGFGWVHDNAAAHLWAIPLLGSMVSLLFWSFECRNRSVLKTATDTAKRIESQIGLVASEKEEGTFGPFTAQKFAARFLAHRTVFNILYPLVAALLVVLSLTIAC